MGLLHRFASVNVVVVWSSCALGGGYVVNESPGDFSNTLTDPTLIAQPLGVGLNEVGGWTQGIGNADFDVFRVILPLNYSIVAIAVDVDFYLPPAIDPFAPSFFELHDAAEGNMGSRSFTGDGRYFLDFTLENWANIVFRLTAPQLAGPGSQGSYRYNVLIWTVPAPASAGVMLGAAWLVGGRRRRVAS